MSGAPQPIPALQLQTRSFDTATSLDLRAKCYATVGPQRGLLDRIAQSFVCSYMAGSLGHVRAGDVWHGPDGRRLVLQANFQLVVYMRLDTRECTATLVYEQSAAGFTGDLIGDVARRVGEQTAPLKPVIEAELYFLMGFTGAMSTPLFLAMTGAEILKFVVENRDNFPKWSAAIGKLLAARSALKTHAPTLYEKIVEAALAGTWEGIKVAVGYKGVDVAGRVPKTVWEDPKILWRSLGTVVGKFGKNLTASRLSALRICWTILSQVAMTAAKGLPGAVKLTSAEEKAKAEELIQALREARVILTEQDVERIFAEVRAHEAELGDALRSLQESFAELLAAQGAAAR